MFEIKPTTKIQVSLSLTPTASYQTSFCKHYSIHYLVYFCMRTSIWWFTDNVHLRTPVLAYVNYRVHFNLAKTVVTSAMKLQCTCTIDRYK